MPTYVIISPVRNEEEYVRLTLDSVVNQTVVPSEWIMVNDGSVDSTAEIIKEYIPKYPWIKLITLKDRGYYFPGTGVVNVFYKGYEQITTPDWEYVVKLDCDLKFDFSYFELLLKEFDKDSKLGIASGCTYLQSNGTWVIEPVLEDHPVGPSKVYKRECWDQIGGLKPIPGWDLADLLAAQMNGWKTFCFKHLKIEHYRLTGSRRKGIWAPKFLQGKFEYKHGYTFNYTFLKSIYHFFSKPVIIGSIAKICGYLYARTKKEDYLFDEDMRIFLRKKHKSVFRQKLSHMIRNSR
jgi:poly-beta-1,6-N-acetyl-D-glucosamine synthase